jgi:hypothetical protein
MEISSRHYESELSKNLDAWTSYCCTPDRRLHIPVPSTYVEGTYLLGHMVGVAGTVASLLPTHGLFVPNLRDPSFTRMGRFSDGQPGPRGVRTALAW